MSSWPMVSLGNHLSQRSADVVVDPVARYRTTGVLSHGKGFFWRPEISGAETSYTKFTQLRTNDFVFSKLFGWEGALGVISEAFDGGLVSSEFPVFDVDLAALDPAYLGYVVRRPDFYEGLATSGMGNRRQRVNPRTVLNSEIPLPPIDEQRRIAAWLAEIEGRRRALDELRSRSRLLATSTVESIVDELSNTFGTVALSVGISLRRPDQAVLPESQLKLAGVYSHGGGMFVRGDISGSDTQYSVMHTLRPGQFVYSKLKAWEGALAVTMSEHDGCVVSPEFPVFDIDEELLLVTFLRLIIKSDLFLRAVRSSAAGIGARRDRVHPSSVLGIRIPLPPIRVQDRVSRTVIGAGLLRHRARQTRPEEYLLRSALNQVFGS